ncbi:MAG: LptF/LptG family permease [Bacteroidetes bacterium]|nr:LptF/LptG family permease [Bacteroidota bacterium]MCW5894203.1 LptF/LptG family permease [Bacteroidota bacterium]
MKLHVFPRHLSFYLLRAHIGPFLFSLCTLMFLFLLQFVMKFIDQLVGKGLSAWTIFELITLNLAWMLVLAVPMSVLVAVLMAFGDLSSRNEITAMKASGVSIYRMMAPVVVTAGILATLLVVFNNDVLPEANHRAKTLTMDIRRKRPTFSMVAGLFSQEIQGYSMLVKKTFEKSNDLEGITLYDYTNPNSNVVITAERGTISFSQDTRKLIMDLHRGEIHELNLANMVEYKRIRFENHRIVTDVQGFDFERTEEGTVMRGDRELSAHVMLGIVDSLQQSRQKLDSGLQHLVTQDMERLLTGLVPQKPAPPAEGQITFGTFNMPAQLLQTTIRGTESAETRVRVTSSTVQNELLRIDMENRRIDQYKVEIHKKYSIPIACIVFVLVGVPLGIMSRRGGFGIAATLSFGFFLMYWAFLIGGEKLADRNLLSPFWGMWAANILLGIIGVYLTLRIGKEAVVIDWGFMRRLIPKRWRKDMPEDASYNARFAE